MTITTARIADTTTGETILELGAINSHDPHAPAAPAPTLNPRQAAIVDRWVKAGHQYAQLAIAAPTGDEIDEGRMWRAAADHDGTAAALILALQLGVITERQYTEAVDAILILSAAADDAIADALAAYYYRPAPALSPEELAEVERFGMATA